MSRTSAALTDLARVVTTVRSGERVEGRSLTAEVTAGMTRARLVPDAVAEGRDEEGQRRVLETASLVLAALDDQGGPVAVTAADRVEVRSGAEWSVWQIRSVEPVRRRRKLIGTICAVERLDDQRVASVLA